MNRRFWTLLLVFALCLTLFAACDAPEDEETASGTESVGTSNEDEGGSASESDSTDESNAETNGGESESNGATETESETQTDEPTESETEKKVVEVDSVTVNRTSLSLKAGERKTLSASVTPFGADNSEIIWSSSDESVATVSSSGVVCGVSGGTATITASTANGKSASCIVTVASKPSSETSSNPETENDPEWSPEESWEEGTGATEDPWWGESETETWLPGTDTEDPWWGESETETDYGEDDTEWNFVYYEVDDENCIIAWGGTQGGSTLTIPSVSPDGVPVTGIDSYGFYSVNAINIVIPDSITYIGSNAFAYCENLESIVIPDGVTQVEYCAFSDCSSLESVQLGRNTQIISNYAFAWCYSLSEITIPESVELIGQNAFAYTSIMTVNIPAGTTSIASNAFSGCSSLREITVDPANEVYETVDGVIYTDDGETLFFYPGGKTETSFEIPRTVTTINDYAFSNCYSIEYVTIPDSVTYIGDYAFAWSDLSEYVFIPDSVMHIGHSAFYGCYSLAGINVDPDNANYSSMDGVLYSNDGENLICYTGGNTNSSFTVPDGVVTIEDYAFTGNSNLVEVIVSDTVETVGDCAFYSCDLLSSVTLGNNVKVIESNAFSYCTSLTEITIPASVTEIQYGMLWGTSVIAVVFENPNGWYIRYGDEAIVTFTPEDLQDSTVAAEYLMDTYSGYIWNRD